MNCIKFLMALAALCVLVMPAFSTFDSGMRQDCKQKMCDCSKYPTGCDGKQMWQGQDDRHKSCDCQEPCDCKWPCDCQNDEHKMFQCKDDGQKSCGCEKSMMGPDDRQKMCQGKERSCDCQESCDCQKPMMGHDCKQKECGCHESMMGRECKHVKSMMGDRDGNGNILMIVVVKR